MLATSLRNRTLVLIWLSSFMDDPIKFVRVKVTQYNDYMWTSHAHTLILHVCSLTLLTWCSIPWHCNGNDYHLNQPAKLMWANQNVLIAPHQLKNQWNFCMLLSWHSYFKSNQITEQCFKNDFLKNILIKADSLKSKTWTNKFPVV